LWIQGGFIVNVFVGYEMLGQTVTSELYQQQFIRVNDTLEERKTFTNSRRRPVILLQDTPGPTKQKRLWKSDLG